MTAPPDLAAYDADYPADPGRGDFAAWAIRAVAPGPERVQVGVDLVLGGDPRHGSAAAYQPCQSRGADGRPDDPYYAACQTSSYYRLITGSTYPHGIFLANEQAGVRHLWAQRVVTSALEIYPRRVQRDAAGAPVLDAQGREVLLPDVTGFGRVRLSTSTHRLADGSVADAFPVHANGGSYTRPVGVVSLPAATDPGVSRVNGYARRGTVPAARGEAHLSLFGRTESAVASSDGFPVTSFGAGDNNDRGYFTSGLLRPGTYDGNAVRYALDAEGRATSVPELHLRFVLRVPVSRIDLHLDESDLGLSRYPAVSRIRPA